jgi:hypothetical protein
MTSHILVPLRCIQFDVTPNENCRVFVYGHDGPKEITEAGTVETPLIYVHRKEAVIRSKKRSTSKMPATSCYCSAWASGSPMEHIDQEVRAFMAEQGLPATIASRTVLRAERYTLDPDELLLNSGGKVVVT